jgi:N utilization substance protein A
MAQIGKQGGDVDPQAVQGFRDQIAEIGWLNDEDRLALVQNGVRSLDDLADLAADELLEIVGTGNLNAETASKVIMAARAHWFEGA